MKKEYASPLAEVTLFRSSTPIASDDVVSDPDHDNGYVDWSLRPDSSEEDES